MEDTSTPAPAPEPYNTTIYIQRRGLSGDEDFALKIRRSDVKQVYGVFKQFLAQSNNNGYISIPTEKRVHMFAIADIGNITFPKDAMVEE